MFGSSHPIGESSRILGWSRVLLAEPCERAVGLMTIFQVIVWNVRTKVVNAVKPAVSQKLLKRVDDSLAGSMFRK